MSVLATNTIFAQASALGKAGVSVVRLSGPRAAHTLQALCGNGIGPRLATLRWIRDPESGEKLDQALILWFPAPASFTGDDVAEFHLHGSPAVVRRLLTILGNQPDHRMAEPGEFTRRAILNDKMDIVQAEGLGDLLSAETEAQRRQAAEVLNGKLSKLAGQWRDTLLQALALLEVSIDFSDEDLPQDLLAEVHGLVTQARTEMALNLSGSKQAERLREGFEVAIVGPPNVGKSTLFNFLAGREAAITSPQAGTTRDVIELAYDLDGIPVTFLDTAGLRRTDDLIETMGVARALERARGADLRIFLSDPEGMTLLEDLRPSGSDLKLAAKSDLGPGGQFRISGKTGEGVQEMLEKLKGLFEEMISGASLVSHERQRKALADAVSALELIDLAGEGIEISPELVSADIQTALNALDHLVGRFDIETVFDLIFQNFCLGK